MTEVTIYFDKGRRMVRVLINQIAETIERLMERGYTPTSVQ